MGGADFGDIGDIFETIFGSAFGGGRQQQRRGADLRYDLQITLDEAFHGKDTEIEIEVSQTCDTCNGSGAEPGTGTRGCNLCNGYGKVRAQQGFFMVERPCPIAADAAKLKTRVIRAEVKAGSTGRRRWRSVPPASIPARVSACRARARPGREAHRPAISTFSCT